MKGLVSQMEAVDLLFSKVEVYMSRKHRNQLLKVGDASGTDSNTSGSPKSSDRHHTFEDDSSRRLDFDTEEASKPLETKETSKKFIFPSEEDEIAPVRVARKSLLEDDFDRNAFFKDFTEPDLIKTGYLIPLACGHNGQLSINEKLIYEIHLTNAGFVKD